MTDAEIVRFIAENARMDLDDMCKRAWMVPADDLPEGDIDEAMQNAADAIEENARLRALLGEASDYVDALTGDPTPGDAASHAEARDLLAKITAALRKPDAAGGDDAS